MSLRSAPALQVISGVKLVLGSHLYELKNIIKIKKCPIKSNKLKFIILNKIFCQPMYNSHVGPCVSKRKVVWSDAETLLQVGENLNYTILRFNFMVNIPVRGRCLVNQIVRCLFFIKRAVFHHLQLEIVLEIPASNEWKILTIRKCSK